MSLSELKNKKIVFLGLGLENYAVLEYLLAKKIIADFFIIDLQDRKKLLKKYLALKELEQKQKISYLAGKKFQTDFTKFDYVFRSPGSAILKNKKIKLGQAILTSPSNFFFAHCPSKKIIGITGTKGKGTTASLIYHILKQAGQKVWLGGNIGVAPVQFLFKIKKQDWVVLELSSFQLEDCQFSPHIAVFTNFTKEHLLPADPHNPNYHQNMSAYWQAKLNIARWQKKSDYLVINEKLRKKIKKEKILSKIIYFQKSDLENKLPGEHNQENIAAAVAVARLARIKVEVIKRAVQSFQGLEYRLQLIRSLRGVEYYNDSFATTPEATITALKSFSQPIILLAGGADKGSNFASLAREIKKRVKVLILLSGKATNKIKQAVLKTGFSKDKIIMFSDLRKAVQFAQKQAQLGEKVLLSTACASFGMFKNYKERGKLFTAEVKKLK